MTDKKYDGCPCGTNGKCCENPEPQQVEHECSDEDVCEGCYELECANCGASCSCDL